MKIKFITPILLCFFCCTNLFTNAQSFGDYRSNPATLVGGYLAGIWSATSSWEVFNGTSWVAASTAPTSSDGQITIQLGDSIILNASTNIDQVTVENGAVLTVIGAGSVTLNNDIGNDIIINGKMYLANCTLSGTGTILSNVTGTFSLSFSGVLSVNVLNEGITNLNNTAILTNSTLTNNNTIVWSSNNINMNNSSIINNDSIAITATTNVQINNSSGTNSVISNSSGIINKDNASGIATFFVSFTNAGKIKGIGTISFSGSVSNTGIIAPGNSPGILTTTPNAVTGSPIVALEIVTTGAGSGYDQLNFNAATNVSAINLIVVENTSAPLANYDLLNTSAGVFSGSFNSILIPLGYTLNYTPGVSTSISVTKNYITLPAVWGDFNAVAKNNNQVTLNWTTLQESNVSNYQVEFSTNGIFYTTAGIVNATGTTNSKTAYCFEHTTPDVQKTNYYRIKQIDFDNKSAYSVIRPVRFSKGIVVSVMATPNPVRDRLQVSIQADKIEILLVDLSGRTVKNMKLQPGNHEINVANLASGFYQLVVLQDGVQIETQKIIKQ